MSTTLEPDATTRAAEPDPQACPNCGAPATAGQLMCLECGSRLALEHGRPASWKIAGAIIGVVVLLAGTALALALAEVTDDADSRSGAPAATQPAASTPDVAPAETGTAPAETGTAPAESAPAPAATETAPAESATDAQSLPDSDTAPVDAGSATWPEGKRAHTVILASAGSRQEAEAKQKQAQDAGITAGILKSDDFGSLRPGYWVVFDGQFDSVEEATKRAEEDRGKGFADAYPRYVDPS